MTEQAQRLAIAKWMGWRCEANAGRTMVLVQWHQPDGTPAHPHPVIEGSGELGYLPDYTRDLNAMASALERLESRDWRKFVWWLEHIKKLGHIEDGCRERDTVIEMLLINSSAAQRAEALLRCIGKWQE